MQGINFDNSSILGNNRNAFSNVKVGSTTIAADTKTDTLELVAGNNVTLTPDATNDKVTIAATDTTYSSKAAASGGTAVSLVTTGEKYTWNNLHYKLTDGTVIPEGADLDDATYRTPGNYICETNAKAHTIKHFPGYDGTTLVSTRANAFKLFVGYAQGGSNYIAQELRDYFNGAVYYRWYYSSWSTWRAVRGTASVLISELDTADEDIKDSTLISTSGVNGETRIWYKRAATAFWNYIKGKSDAVYSAINHKHAANDVTDLVTATAYGPTGLVSFQDAHGGLPLKKCLVSIMPAQSGSGDPSPTNVRPISGREHVKVWRFGKNFFPREKFELAVGDGNGTVAFPHPLPAGSYTFSADLTSTFDGACIVHMVRKDDTTIQFSLTPGSRVSGSFTSPSGNEIKVVRFYAGDKWATSINNSAVWSNIQVETGSTATAYEASETVVDADLPELMYGGTLDVLTGKLTVTHGYIKPSEYTGSSISDTTVVVFTRIPLGKRGTSYNIVSNVATGAARTDANIARYGYAVDQSISSVDESPLLFIAASTTAHPTTASLSQALLDADACFAYELETPEVYQLTPSQVASLAGQNHIWADAGNITVEYGAFLQALEGAAEAGRTYTDRHYVTAGKKSGTTLGTKATAEGNDTTASGEYAHAEGRITVAIGNFSHAEGNNTTAKGFGSHAEGASTTTTENAHYSHAEGDSTTTSAQNAHAEGYDTTASNNASHAEGNGTTASGPYSHAEGNHTTASGKGSHAEGDHTTASMDYQHVFGKMNVPDTHCVEVVGWGTDSKQKNIRTLDTNGNMTLAGKLTLGAAPTANMDAATKQYVDAHYVTAGKKSGTTLGEYATAEGANTTASGSSSHAEGANTTASGASSHAEGIRTSAEGQASHAEGYETIAIGPYQHVFGKYNVQNISDVEIVGWGTSATNRKDIRSLASNGNEWIAGTLTQSSDARLKDVAGEIPDVSSIRAVRFRWNDVNGEHDDRDHIGYLAQDVEKLAPFLVGDDSNGYKSLDYIALLCAKIEILERQVKELLEKF